MTSDGVLLPGLQGHNPLAVLAAFGALSLATDGADSDMHLAWRQGERAWLPALFSDGLDRQAVQEAIMRGHGIRNLDSELGWAHDVMRVSRDEVRRLLQDRLSRGARREADVVAAAVSELPLRPPAREYVAYTPFRLMPRRGRARFLEKIKGHSAHKQAAASVEAALFEDWEYTHANSLGWDPAAGVAARAYSAEAPTFTGPRGVPGALLLAARGWTLFPMMQSRRRATTPGLADGNHFVWPIWTDPLNEDALRLLLRLPALYDGQDGTDRDALARHGVVVRMVAERAQTGDDGAVFTWGEDR